MSLKTNYKEEAGESFGEISQLNELYYNCTECNSPIEILSINEKEYSIEFRCINNNHKLKMTIKEFIDKMKFYNNKNINNDTCKTHNTNFERYCKNCKKHLCRECLISSDHIGHNIYNISEYQPSKTELNIIENIIKYYKKKNSYIRKRKNK